MKSAALVSIALLFGSIISTAQSGSYNEGSYNEGRNQSLSPSPQANSLTIVSLGSVPTFCPVSLSARHGATGGTMQASKGLPKGPAQLLHLTLVNPDSREIVSARFIVRGVSGKARVAQALSNSNDDDVNTVRTVAAQFSRASGNAVTGDLWVPGMTAVLALDVTSVTFADGTTRSFTPRDGCRVAPDMKMLVAGR